jgi:hypothetical protein
MSEQVVIGASIKVKTDYSMQNTIQPEAKEVCGFPIEDIPEEANFIDESSPQEPFVGISMDELPEY